MTNNSIYPALCADATLIRELLDYNPDTGIFTWKFREKNVGGFNSQFAGKEAGNIMGDGYRKILFKSKPRLAHRLAWLHYYGKYPEQTIDHFDRNRSNNAISNLSDCSQYENNQNKEPWRKSSGGVEGVSYIKTCKRWRVMATINGEIKYFGHYITLEEALEVHNKIKHLNDGSKYIRKKKNYPELTHELLLKLVYYDPLTGNWFRYRKDRMIPVDAKPNKIGYYRTSVNGKNYLLHCLAFFYMNGKWPVGQIDHKDGIKNNCKWENLREVCRSKNALNRSISLPSRGVKQQSNGKWRSRISIDGKRLFLGDFVTQEEAFIAYDKAYFDYMGEMPQPRPPELVSNKYSEYVKPTHSSSCNGVRQKSGKWSARIGIKNKRLHLGTFETQEEAFAAYDNAYFEYTGEMPLPRLPMPE